MLQIHLLRNTTLLTVNVRENRAGAKDRGRRLTSTFLPNNLKVATDKGQITCGLFLDLSKAFDSKSQNTAL